MLTPLWTYGAYKLERGSHVDMVAQDIKPIIGMRQREVKDNIHA
jgi:hypothetical protein